jgi:hypothetical protein
MWWGNVVGKCGGEMWWGNVVGKCGEQTTTTQVFMAFLFMNTKFVRPSAGD